MLAYITFWSEGNVTEWSPPSLIHGSTVESNAIQKSTFVQDGFAGIVIVHLSPPTYVKSVNAEAYPDDHV